MSNTQNLKTGQVVHLKRNGFNYYWHIESICYGGTNQESVMHLSPADGRTNPDCLGKKQAIFIPESMFLSLLESGLLKVYEPFKGDRCNQTWKYAL